MRTKIDCILDHKTNLNIFLDHNGIKLEISNTRIIEKKISKHLEIKQRTLNPWVKEVLKDIKKILGTKENENATYPHLYDDTKTVLKEKLIAVYVYIRKEERSLINNWRPYLKKPKEEQNEPKATRRK